MAYLATIAGLLITLALTSSCGRAQDTASATPEPPRKPPARTAVRQPTVQADSLNWLAADSATKTVNLTLVATRPSGTPSALINGYRAGKARVVVPVGWTVRWNWRNADPTSPHSLVVMVQREKVPLEGGRPAFSNAMTKAVVDGLPLGQTDQTTFEAEEAGWYWLLCGVPSHALEGEWIELRIDPEGKTARAEVKS
jgi:hypothetical protein